jgi:EmrB/QacA subfamily drug resistance transporter
MTTTGDTTRSAPRGPDGADAGGRRRWIVLALLVGAQFVVVLDAAIVTVALPSIAADLRFAQRDLSWVVNAYVLTFGGFLLLGGRLADLLGRRRVFVTGLVGFAIASLADGLAGSPGQLVAARAAQGLCAALLSPAALSILTATFQPGPQRNRALGVWAAAGASGGAAGVLLGGVLTGSVGWRWVFWVNVPVAITAAALALCLVAGHRAPRTGRHVDLAGGASITAGLSLLVYALVGAPGHGWVSIPTLTGLGGAAALIAAFVVIELRARSPLVPFGVFRGRALSGSNLTMLIFFPGMAAMFFFVSLYLQQVLGYHPLAAGLAQLPLALGIIVFSRVGSRLATRYGARAVLFTGLILLAAALVWFGQVSPAGGFVTDVLGPSLLAAAGAGMAFVTLTILAMGDTGEAEAGLASGLINTSQQLGAALGLAVLASVADSRTQHVLAAAHDTGSGAASALSAGYQSAFLGGAGFVLTALVVAVLFTRHPLSSGGSRVTS